MNTHNDDHEKDNPTHEPVPCSDGQESRLLTPEDIIYQKYYSSDELRKVIVALEPILAELRAAARSPDSVLPLAKIKALTQGWAQAQRFHYECRHHYYTGADDIEAPSVGLSVDHYIFGYTVKGYEAEIDFDWDRYRHRFFFENKDNGTLMPAWVSTPNSLPKELQDLFSKENNQGAKTICEDSWERAKNTFGVLYNLLHTAHIVPAPMLPLTQLREVTKSWGNQIFSQVSLYTFFAGSFSADVVIHHYLSANGPADYRVEAILKDKAIGYALEATYHFNKSDE